MLLFLLLLFFFIFIWYIYKKTIIFTHRVSLKLLIYIEFFDKILNMLHYMLIFYEVNTWLKHVIFRFSFFYRENKIYEKCKKHANMIFFLVEFFEWRNIFCWICVLFSDGDVKCILFFKCYLEWIVNAESFTGCE